LSLIHITRSNGFEHSLGRGLAARRHGHQQPASLRANSLILIAREPSQRTEHVTPLGTWPRFLAEALDQPGPADLSQNPCAFVERDRVADNCFGLGWKQTKFSDVIGGCYLTIEIGAELTNSITPDRFCKNKRF
jgi:hypothetical protein